MSTCVCVYNIALYVLILIIVVVFTIIDHHLCEWVYIKFIFRFFFSRLINRFYVTMVNIDRL